MITERALDAYFLERRHKLAALYLQLSLKVSATIRSRDIVFFDCL